MAVTSLLELRLKNDLNDEAREIMRRTLVATRAFDGCLGVEVVVDVDDVSHVTLIEKWESVEHDDAYRAFRASPEGASDLGSVVSAAPVLTRYETDETV